MLLDDIISEHSAISLHWRKSLVNKKQNDGTIARGTVFLMLGREYFFYRINEESTETFWSSNRMKKS